MVLGRTVETTTLTTASLAAQPFIENESKVTNNEFSPTAEDCTNEDIGRYGSIHQITGKSVGADIRTKIANSYINLIKNNNL